MECLRLELERFSITAILIEPGFFRADFLDNSSVSYGDIQIEEYVPWSAETRAALDARNHQQLGDPAKLGAAMLTLIETETPPLRFAAGSDSLGRLFDKAEQLRTEGETWRDLSISTDGSF